MALDWNTPENGTDYLEVLETLRLRDDAIAKLDFEDSSNLPVGYKRLSGTTIQEWSGSSWIPLGGLLTSAAQTVSGQKTFSDRATFNSGLTTRSYLQIDASSAPTWDTNSRLWMESGFGSRYDGFQHRFDIGAARTRGLQITASAVSVGASPSTVGYILNMDGFMQILRASGAAQDMIGFYNGGAYVGGIRTSGSVTSYLTTSEPRLKNDHGIFENALDILNAIEIHEVDFIADETRTRRAMYMAPQLQEHVPQVVTGTRNGMKKVCDVVVDDAFIAEKIDIDSAMRLRVEIENIATDAKKKNRRAKIPNIQLVESEIIDPQMTDHGAMVPYLHKAIQELSKFRQDDLEIIQQLQEEIRKLKNGKQNNGK